ncbi:hypothetical protein [uncultured Winogradskyella sp.]|nr:hypothetical protein [uncultured Winogradskyella sp.]
MIKKEEKLKDLSVKKTGAKDKLSPLKWTLFILFFPISWFLFPSSYSKE